jgi:hypothetical protein
MITRSRNNNGQRYTAGCPIIKLILLFYHAQDCAKWGKELGEALNYTVTAYVTHSSYIWCWYTVSTKSKIRFSTCQNMHIHQYMIMNYSAFINGCEPSTSQIKTDYKRSSIRFRVLWSTGTFLIVRVIATATQVVHTASATKFEAATKGDAQIATVTPATVRMRPWNIYQNQD